MAAYRQHQPTGVEIELQSSQNDSNEAKDVGSRDDSKCFVQAQGSDSLKIDWLVLICAGFPDRVSAMASIWRVSARYLRSEEYNHIPSKRWTNTYANK